MQKQRHKKRGHAALPTMSSTDVHKRVLHPGGENTRIFKFFKSNGHCRARLVNSTFFEKWITNCKKIMLHHPIAVLVSPNPLLNVVSALRGVLNCPGDLPHCRGPRSF